MPFECATNNLQYHIRCLLSAGVPNFQYNNLDFQRSVYLAEYKINMLCFTMTDSNGRNPKTVIAEVEKLAY